MLLNAGRVAPPSGQREKLCFSARTTHVFLNWGVSGCPRLAVGEAYIKVSLYQNTICINVSYSSSPPPAFKYPYSRTPPAFKYLYSRTSTAFKYPYSRTSTALQYPYSRTSTALQYLYSRTSTALQYLHSVTPPALQCLYIRSKRPLGRTPSVFKWPYRTQDTTCIKASFQ